MADAGIADTLSVELQLLLANARDSWKSFRKEVESDPINASVALQGGKGEGRTFGGGTAVLGPENYRKPEPAKPMAGLGTLLDQSLITRGSVGGSGFGPGVRPLPTASVNTVFGGISPGVVLSPVEAAQLGQPLRTTSSRSSVAHTDQEYGRYRVRAVRSGIMDPMSRGDYDREGGFQSAMSEIDYWNEQRARNRSDAAMSRQTVKATPAAAKQEYKLRRGESFGVQPGAGIGFGTAVSVAGVVATALTYADQYIASNQRQGDIGRFDSMLDQAESAYSDQRSVTGLKRTIGGWANNLRDLTGSGRKFSDARSLAESYDNLRSVRADVEARNMQFQAYSTDAATGMIGSSGFGAEAMASREAVNSLVRNRDRSEFRNNPSLMSGLNKQIAAQQRQDAATQADISARSGQASSQAFFAGRIAGYAGDNNQFAAGLGSIQARQAQELFDLNRVTRGMNPSDAAQLVAATNYRQTQEQLGFTNQYSRQSYIQTLGMQAGTLSSFGGGTYTSRTAALSLQRTAALTSLSGYGAYSRGESIGDADRNRILATDNDFRLQQAQLDQSRFASRVSAESSVAMSRMRMMGNPLGADINGIVSGFQTGTVSLSRDSEEFRQQQAIASQNLRESIFNRGFAAMQNRMGLSGSLMSTIRGLERNQIGAAAEGIASSTSMQIQSLAMDNQAANAELARTAGNAQLDLLAKNYGLSFRAEQFDAQNLLINNQRDTQDPAAVLGSIESARNAINNTSSDPNMISADALKEAVSQAIGGDLKQIIQGAIDAVLAK